jgi:hypothetical protein
MSLLDDESGIAAAHAASMLLAPVPTVPTRPERSAWSAPFRGVAGGAAKLAATAAEFEQAASDALPAAEFRQRRREAMGVSLPAVSNVTRGFERGIRPDPETSSLAEKILYGLTSVITAAVPGALVAGPFGAAAAIGGAEGTSAAADLPASVDAATRMQVGLTAGLLSGAGAVVPVVGSTLGRTAALYAASGPGSFVAQQLITRKVLESANYGDLAQQYDPLDGEGWAMSMIPGAPFAGFRAWQLTRSARSKGGPAPRIEPTLEPAAPDAVPPPRGERSASDGTAPPEAIDAAMTHNLDLIRERTDSRIDGVTEQIARGIDDAATGVTPAVISAAQRVRELVAGPARDALDNRSRVVVGELDDATRARITAESGVAVEGSEVRLRADTVRHANGEHPNLTAADWEALPWLVENFDHAVAMKSRPGDKGQRVAMVAIDRTTGVAYLAEVLPGGKKQGPRQNVVTFFKDSPGAIENWLRTNGKKDDDGSSGAGGNPSSPKPAPEGAVPTEFQPPSRGSTDAPVLPSGPQALTSETGSVGSPIVSAADLGRLTDAFEQARAALDDFNAAAAGSKGGLSEFLAARGVPAEVNNLVVGLADAAGSPGRLAGLVQQIAREAGQKFKSPADAAADAVEGMRALTHDQIADLEKPAKPSADPLTQSVTDRLAQIEQTQPDMPIRLDENGNVVTLADEMARVRREAQEGTDTELGALDADLLRVAADCALTLGA